MRKPCKIGVIGCGTIANAEHIPAYSNAGKTNGNVEIKYFCDIIKERAEAAVLKYETGRAVADYRDVLDDSEITAISVCTPNDTHCLITVDALKAGKHVLCEKPAARTYSEALLMQKACLETGKILNIGVVNRFNTAVNKIREIIDSGELGEIYHVYGSFRAHRSIPGLGGPFTTKAVAGGGVLIDWGVHYLDLIMYCLGDPEPKTVSGQAYSKLGNDMRSYLYEAMWAGPPDYAGTYDVDDFVTALIRTDGPTLSINGAWAQNIGVKETFVDFLGTKAGIRLVYGGSFKIFGTKNGMLYEMSPSFTAENMFQKEIDAFLESSVTGEKLPSHIDKVILTSKIMQGIYDSSAQNAEISFN